MGSKELRGRDNWQKNSQQKAEAAEVVFFEVIGRQCDNLDFKLIEKPKSLKDIYGAQTDNNSLV